MGWWSIDITRLTIQEKEGATEEFHVWFDYLRIK